jgi:hypothetical protein
MLLAGRLSATLARVVAKERLANAPQPRHQKVKAPRVELLSLNTINLVHDVGRQPRPSGDAPSISIRRKALWPGAELTAVLARCRPALQRVRARCDCDRDLAAPPSPPTYPVVDVRSGPYGIPFRDFFPGAVFLSRSPIPSALSLSAERATKQPRLFFLQPW